MRGSRERRLKQFRYDARCQLPFEFSRSQSVRIKNIPFIRDVLQEVCLWGSSRDKKRAEICNMSPKFFLGRMGSEREIGVIESCLSTHFVGAREELIFIEWLASVAARLGLEPRQNESESFVLPLHHRAKKIGASSLAGSVGNRAAGRKWSRRWDSNPQPPVYKTGALPLSYAGEKPGRWPKINWEKTETGGSPGTRTPNLLIKSQLLYH